MLASPGGCTYPYAPVPDETEEPAEGQGLETQPPQALTLLYTSLPVSRERAGGHRPGWGAWLCRAEPVKKKKKKGCLGVPTVLKDLALSLQQPRFIHVASTVG